MFRWAIRHTHALLLPALLLAGCATGYHRNVRNVPNWEAEDGNGTGNPSAVPGDAAAPQIIAPLPEPQVAASASVSAPPVTSSPSSSSPAPATNVPPPSNGASVSKPAAARPSEPLPAWVLLSRWCKDHALPPPRASLFGQQPTFSITTASGVFSFHIGSTVASWQGVQLWLGFVPRLIDGQPALHALDVQKNFLPLTQGGGLAATGQHTIVIDPGHGGENGGTTSVVGHGLEKDYTLDWARRVAPLLQANGWTVFLTRTNDTDLALSNRVAFAEQHHADLFVSLHFNSAAPDETQFGLETYCLPPAGMPSGVTRGFSDEIHLTFPNNAFDAQNLELALRVQRGLLAVNGGHDRGVRRARFPGVLRNQHRPAILIEGGYLSNPGEATLIATSGHRQKLAEALALAIGPAETRIAQAQEATVASAPAATPPRSVSSAGVPLPASVTAPAPATSPAAGATSKSALYDEP